MQAIIYRAHQLKAITDNQYQYMMRQVSKKGWRTNELGDTPYYFIQMGRPSFPRRPVWAAPARVSAAVSMGQEHTKPPFPHSLPPAAGRPRPARQERARPPRLCSLPSVTERRRPAQQERARPPRPCSLPSVAGRHRPARQERAEPPLPHSLPSAAERHRPAQQEHAKAPFRPSPPSVAEGPRPVWQENPSQSPAQARRQSASNPIPIRRP